MSGRVAVPSRAGNVERALYQGLILSGAIAAAAFYPVTRWLMHGISFRSVGDQVTTPSVLHLWLCSLIGIGVTALLFVLTDFYTSTRFSPVKKTTRASVTGHATNIIPCFASGLHAPGLPALGVVLWAVGRCEPAG